MDSSAIIGLVGGRRIDDDIAQKNFLSTGEEEPKDMEDQLHELVQKIEEKQRSDSDSGARSGASSTVGPKKATKKATRKSKATYNDGEGHEDTLRLVQIVKCPASRMVVPDLLKLAFGNDDDLVVPKPCDWESIEIDETTGELCLPSDYAARIRDHFKGTAAAASARLMKDAASLVNNKTEFLSDGFMDHLAKSMETMTQGQFDSIKNK